MGVHGGLSQSCMLIKSYGDLLNAYGVASGGPVAILYGELFAGVGSLTIAASLAELYERDRPTACWDGC